MKTTLCLLFCIVLSLFSKGQTWENLSEIELRFVNMDIDQYKLRGLINNSKFDSVVCVHYKGALYMIARWGDSIKVVQNISVDKIDNPTNKKTIKHQINSKAVFEGLMDTFIISRSIFDSLYDLKKHPKLNIRGVKSLGGSPESDDDVLYFSIFNRNGNTTTFKINPIWSKNSSLQLAGWQIRRLLLQLYLNYDHWYNITRMIRVGKRGYYVANNIIMNSRVYYFDGRNKFIETYSKNSYRVWRKYYPIEFVIAPYPKPDNKYPIEPPCPPGVLPPCYIDR
jgi:hypothetical protein